MHRPMVASTLVVLALGACAGGTDAGTDKTVDTDTDTTPAYPESIVFKAVDANGPVACGQDIAGLGSTDAVAKLRDLRFYVSELVLSGPSGEQAIVPDQDGVWQYTDTVLIDLEDGTGSCSETGNPEMNDRVTGFIPDGEWDTLTFTLGVPFDLNHLDLVASKSPLDIPSMFWAWQAGHKFVRIDVANDLAAPNNGWNFHLGAAGCASASSLTPPEADCARPGRARISIPFDPFDNDVVLLDLEALFRNVDIRTNLEGSPSGCMTDPSDTNECGPLFAALGMSFGTGACVDDCANQIAFHKE
ncbi:MAG: metallo-mystery pair system four-Cys motif protein [Alphaproteobacteria bacterium]|nr:metallo-mystery pair system four-Cys motif protein [Alphaproteobacteria bacterium]